MKSAFFLASLLLVGCLATPPPGDPADLPWQTIEVKTQEDQAEGGLRHFRLTALGPVAVRFGGSVSLPSYSDREGCLLVVALPSLAEGLTPHDPGALQDAWTMFGESSVEAGAGGQGPVSVHGPVLGGMNVAGGSSGRTWSLASGDRVDVWLGGPAGVSQIGFGVANLTSQGAILWEELPRTAVRCGIGISQAEGAAAFLRRGDTQAGVGGTISFEATTAATLFFAPSASGGTANSRAHDQAARVDDGGPRDHRLGHHPMAGVGARDVLADGRRALAHRPLRASLGRIDN